MLRMAVTIPERYILHMAKAEPGWIPGLSAQPIIAFRQKKIVQPCHIIFLCTLLHQTENF